jgi:hypothetical protein
MLDPLFNLKHRGLHSETQIVVGRSLAVVVITVLVTFVLAVLIGTGQAESESVIRVLLALVVR